VGLAGTTNSVAVQPLRFVSVASALM